MNRAVPGRAERFDGDAVLARSDDQPVVKGVVDGLRGAGSEIFPLRAGFARSAKLTWGVLAEHRIGVVPRPGDVLDASARHGVRRNLQRLRVAAARLRDVVDVPHEVQVGPLEFSAEDLRSRENVLVPALHDLALVRASDHRSPRPEIDFTPVGEGDLQLVEFLAVRGASADAGDSADEVGSCRVRRLVERCALGNDDVDVEALSVVPT